MPNHQFSTAPEDSRRNSGGGDNLRAQVMNAQTGNPALQRLQSRVLASAQASEVITSYDRMHHRHNRSSDRL